MSKKGGGTKRCAINTLCFQVVVAVFHHAQRRVVLKLGDPHRYKTQGFAPDLVMCRLQPKARSAAWQLEYKTGRVYAHPVGDQFLEGLGECPRRDLAMELDGAVLRERVGEGEGVELDVRIPVCEPLEDRSNDAPSAEARSRM